MACFKTWNIQQVLADLPTHEALAVEHNMVIQLLLHLEHCGGTWKTINLARHTSVLVGLQ